MTVIATALARGCTYGQLGALLGIDRDAARMRAVRAGLRSSHERRPPNPETAGRIKTARKMKAEGCDLEEIAERLRMPSKDAVRMMLKRAGDA
jgi:DNA-directed RNA polymerase specialized sigma24 family protein